MKGLGVPRLRGRGRGDLYVHVVVETPTDLDAAQRELLVHLAMSPGRALDPPVTTGCSRSSARRSADVPSWPT